ncbi:hypothetical protein GCM10020254_38930 [Streptomyces goshikiensis]
MGALDASMNMLGVSLQRAYGRSIMLGFHAAYSLGGIVGASAAWAGAHWHLSLLTGYFPAVAVLLPLVFYGSRFYVGHQGGAEVVPEKGLGGRRVQAAAAAVPGDGVRVHRGLDGLELERQVPPGRAGGLGAAGDGPLQRVHGDDADRAGSR